MPTRRKKLVTPKGKPVKEDCSRCGAAFECGRKAASCWCEALPPVKPKAGESCLCRGCLEKAGRPR